MTVSDQIIAVIKELCNQFGIAVDWTAENVLPYIQKLCEKFIQYEIATSIMWIILPVCCVAIFAITTSILHKKAIAIPEKYNKPNSYYTYDSYDDSKAVSWFAVFSWIILGIAIVWTLIAVPKQIIDIITAKTFPEKMIFDYVSGLITTNN